MRDMYRFGLLGHNIGYTRSPDVFRAVYHRLHGEGNYKVFDFNSEQLSAQWTGILRMKLQGLSVTIPHKATVIALLSEVDSLAAKLVTVNCIKIEDEHTIGYNTDCHGFTVALKGVAGGFKANSALIIGNGSVARAVAYSVVTDFGVTRLVVSGRNKTRLAAFSRSMRRLLPDTQIDSAGWNDLSHQQVDLIVNCTPLGGPSYPCQTPLPCSPGRLGAAAYCDVNYNPDSPMVNRARAEGLRAMDGSTMLVAQALRTFEICAGVSAPPLEAVYYEVFGRPSQVT